MVALPVFRPEAVYHVGSMSGVPEASSKTSYEGPCLSVSLCPEAWERIAKLGGRVVNRLECAEAAFVRVREVTPETVGEAVAWAVAVGYVERSEIFRGWYFNDELEEWNYAECETLAEAVAEVCSMADVDTLEEAEEVFGGVPEFAEGLVVPAATTRLTQAGRLRCPRYPANSEATDAALILWVDEVIHPADPTVAGLWWDEDFDVDRLTAPRGAIVPTALAGFLISQGRPETDDETLLATGQDPSELLDVTLRHAPSPC